MQIGNVQLDNNVISAPMAGVSDKPYRHLVRQMGASLAVSEMLTSRPDLRDTKKTKHRMDITDEQGPISIQLVGTEPELLAEAARFNVDNGADLIDINMGCPAKKVCKKLAGSSLLGDEILVAKILEAVVNAVNAPVTLKIRTGLTPELKNALNIAKIAEQSGIQALTIHGRTRQCKFVGAVEYATIAQVKNAVNIPIIANGDIDSPEKAIEVLTATDADAVMIGRAAQGKPWLFDQVSAYLKTGEKPKELETTVKRKIILNHILAIHEFYGEHLGLKLARKHIGWYLNKLSPNLVGVRSEINTKVTARAQYQALDAALSQFINLKAKAA